jgi:hypothetical protein
MNTHHKLLVVVAMMAMTLSLDTLAYDTPTHAAMTSAAIQQSQITSKPNDSLILKKLGLYNKDDVFKERYIDIGSIPTNRNGTSFENDIMKDVRKVITDIPQPYTIPGWILRGTIREDDNTKETPQGTPQGDEPGGVFQRSYGHFYDPYYNRGLTVGPRTLGVKATDWALTPGSTIPVTPIANPIAGQNRYNIPAAREAMWRALTLTEISANGTLTKITPIGGLVSYAADEAERKAYWATTFRAVGDMVHLIQDMAQPQHTRNDAHAGLGCIPGTDICVAGHASFYEEYMNARTLQSESFSLDEGLTSTSKGTLRRTTRPQLDYCCYAPPKFANYKDYFSTGGNGKGMADYSNRGFFSFGTNLGDFSPLVYPQPSESNLGDVTISGSNVLDMSGNVVDGGNATMTFKVGTVTDALTGSADAGVKLSTLGIFDQFLIEKKFAPRYTLNYYNYDDQAKLLIPRAVGYSAGLIDYFFRGTLEIRKPTEGVFAAVDHAKPENQCTFNPGTNPGCGFKKIKTKLKNATADIVVPNGGGTFKQDMSGGKLYAVAKYHNNACFDPSFQSPIYGNSFNTGCHSAEEVITLSDAYSATPFTLNAGEEKELEFTFNTNAIPFSATDLYIQVVYRGKLGAEDDAVVVGTYDVSEPTFITLANYTDVKIDVANKTCAVNPPGLPQSPFDFDAKLYVLQGKLTDPGPPQYKELVVTRLDPGQYVRLAFLGDALEANMFARAFYTATRDVWFRMDNGVPAIASQVVIPTFFQRKDDGLLYYPNEEYKVREGYGHQWGVYNSRFLGSVFNLPTAGATYDDVVTAMKNCPGTMTLQPIVTLAF